MRITGGEFRSRRLTAPPGTATRPTADRVREALFSILASLGPERELTGASVLDIYAGTGALALEALSRGARCAVLVEKSRQALDAIRANIASLGVGDRAVVLASPAERAVSRFAAREEIFDFVFADPPYADVRRSDSDGDAPALRVLSELVRAGSVTPSGVVVLEHASADRPPPIEGLQHNMLRTYGDTALSFYSST